MPDYPVEKSEWRSMLNFLHFAIVFWSWLSRAWDLGQHLKVLSALGRQNHSYNHISLGMAQCQISNCIMNTTHARYAIYVV